MPFHNLNFKEFLEEKCGITSDELIVAGVSGGADSLYLVRHLQLNGNPVIAVTFDHQLRPGSASEAEFVHQLCLEWGIPFLYGVENIREYAETNHLSIEEAARECRYKFLFREAEKASAAAVATGHHADDQAETVLMHLIRGSGLDGLAAIRPRSFQHQWSSTIPLIRPLLQIRRAEVETWCKGNHLTPVMDESNQDNLFFRNRIRNNLLPLLAKEYNPNIRTILSRTAESFQNDVDFMNAETIRYWNQTILKDFCTEEQIVFSRAINSLPVSIQSRLIRKAAFQLRPNARDFDFEAIQSALNCFNSSKRLDRVDLPEKLTAFRQDEFLILAVDDPTINFQDFPQLPAGEPQRIIDIPSETKISNWSIRIECEVVSPDEIETLIKGIQEVKNQCIFDADKITLPMVIRPAKVGEKFKPFGLHGKRQKISDFWINWKIPQPLRAHYPVIADQKEILWIPKLQTSDGAKITSETRKIIRLTFDRSRSSQVTRFRISQKAGN